jgi:hypothetical protein
MKEKKKMSGLPCRQSQPAPSFSPSGIDRGKNDCHQKGSSQSLNAKYDTQRKRMVFGHICAKIWLSTNEEHYKHSPDDFCTKVDRKLLGFFDMVANKEADCDCGIKLSHQNFAKFMNPHRHAGKRHKRSKGSAVRLLPSALWSLRREAC